MNDLEKELKKIEDKGDRRQEEFVKFKENEFHHLVERVSKIERSVSFIKGNMYILVPLAVAIFGIVLGIIFTVR